MTLFSILETILIGPLKLVFDIVFSIANKLIGHAGLSIIFLSLVMNILVLPLYRRADAMQEEARDVDAKLQDMITHIKKTFTGDERMMILQTYYRQNNYSPVSALNGSVSLLLEIPFFMAAYQFLSHLEILDGVALGPIANLGAPDGLIVIGSLTLNLLPILMTLINVISSAIYLKGFPLKTKIQLYAMALFFLVFLYNSPSCLVFYWTLNNVFSLVKNVFYKLKNPQKVLYALTTALGVLVLGFVFFVYRTTSIKRKVLVAAIGFILLLPLIFSIIKKLLPAREAKEITPDKKVFLLASVFLTILVGVLIPSAFISASPQEFIDLNHYYNPVWFVVSATCLAAGTFLVWMRVFYWLANDSGKVIFEHLIWILCGIMLIDYMFFGTDLGVIYSNLQYERGLLFSNSEILLNLAVLCGLSLTMLIVFLKKKKLVSTVLLTAVIAVGFMSALNVNTIVKSGNNLSDVQKMSDPQFELSQTGNNVVVIMLDRAMGQYVPYIFNEKPELLEKFDGFTYYPNTVSYGVITNVAVPALLGGYEYTPVEMNKRDDELLVDKHNEALKVMPVLFAQNGYDVTVLDPVYANYQQIPDLSIYDEYPEINAYITKGRFDNAADSQTLINNNHRNFFCLSIMKTMPVIAQSAIYDHGRYHQAATSGTDWFSAQVTEGISLGSGMNTKFMSAYNVMLNMNSMTTITDAATDTFMLMTNDTTHEPVLLQTPYYSVAQTVDNTQYDAEHTSRFFYNGMTLKMDNAFQMGHYHVNMAAMLQLANWFDYLRENNVYDNTKIILVADHGKDIGQLDQLLKPVGDGVFDIENHYPLLMVKDFGATGFAASNEFMTNADVPTLAAKDLIENPVNPFTGKAINSSEKTAHAQYLSTSTDYKIEENNGYTYLPSTWVSVKDDMWNLDNWTIFDEITVLSEHTAP